MDIELSGQYINQSLSQTIPKRVACCFPPKNCPIAGGEGRQGAFLSLSLSTFRPEASLSPSTPHHSSHLPPTTMGHLLMVADSSPIPGPGPVVEPPTTQPQPPSTTPSHTTPPSCYRLPANESSMEQHGTRQEPAILMNCDQAAPGCYRSVRGVLRSPLKI